MKKTVWLMIFLGVLVWSAIAPKDGITWILEAFPALLALLIILFTHQRFPLTPLAYQLILFHATILFVGAHYTYAEVPLFTDIQNWLGTARNDYDKLGHLTQGFVPAIIAREVLIRFEVFNRAAWRNFFIICFVLAVSASYELLEWATALISNEASEAFLGTQGYEWDTQSDMFWALVGAAAALIVLSRLHQKQLDELLKQTKSKSN